MQRDRGRNSRWWQTVLSLAIALGSVVVIDTLVLLFPTAQIQGIRLAYIVVLGIALALTLTLLIVSQRRPPSQSASAIRVGNVEIMAYAGGMITPLIMAGILNATVQQLELLKQVKARVDEQSEQLPVLQADLTKIAGDMKTMDNKNLGIQVLLAIVTTLIGFAGSIVLMLLSTPSGGR